ncbi:MAG: CRTAC1 family protein [Bacteroidota bacterium]
MAQVRASIRTLFLSAILLLACCGKQPAEQPAPVNETGIAFSYVDITGTAGLDSFQHETGATGDKYFPEAMGAGAAFIDYNDDGWQDILLVGGGQWDNETDTSVPALWLYKNLGDATFEDATAEAGLEGIEAYGYGLTIGDYDNDGDDDIYFTTLGPNYLLENRAGVFVDVSVAANAQAGATWSTTPVFFDADLDGWLDLYVGNYVDWSPEKDIFCTLDGTVKSYCTPELYTGLPSRFLHNNGDGTFTDQTEAAGFLPSPGKMLGAAVFDYNGDHWPDLVVASDTQPDLLYKNNGDGTFVELGALSGLAYDENGRARAGMGIDTGVIDTSGRHSVFVGNFSKEMIAVFGHVGGDLFVDRAAASQIGRPSLMTLTFGLFLFDPDLDGDLDLFAANGHVQEEIAVTQDGITYAQPPHLFLNDGAGKFADAAPEIGGVLDAPLVGRGAAYADIDRDGDLDILITENGGKAHLWRNDQETERAWLRVSVQGTAANRSGLGTKLVAYHGGAAQERWIRGGSSFMAQHEQVATWGFGSAPAVIDSLVVYWPGGARQQFDKVLTNREFRIVQDVEVEEIVSP